MRKEQINEENIQKLIESNEKLTKELQDFQKIFQKKDRLYDKEIREMLNSIKEFNEKFLDFSNTIKLLQERKDGIDAFIEKIKKVLPII